MPLFSRPLFGLRNRKDQERDEAREYKMSVARESLRDASAALIAECCTLKDDQGTQRLEIDQDRIRDVVIMQSLAERLLGK